MEPINPVHQEGDGKWWFWIETWADRIGPYETKEQAESELTRYCQEVLGP
jgi:hypothetical protein